MTSSTTNSTTNKPRRVWWGVKTVPQHTTYDAMLKVWQNAHL